MKKNPTIELRNKLKLYLRLLQIISFIGLMLCIYYEYNAFGVKFYQLIRKFHLIFIILFSISSVLYYILLYFDKKGSRAKTENIEFKNHS